MAYSPALSIGSLQEKEGRRGGKEGGKRGEGTRLRARFLRTSRLFFTAMAAPDGRKEGRKKEEMGPCGLK